MIYEITLTDAIHDGFGWSANGSTVHRAQIAMPDDHTKRQLWLEARKKFGYNGVRGRYLDDCTWMPYRSCMMIYILENYDDDTL